MRLPEKHRGPILLGVLALSLVIVAVFVYYSVYSSKLSASCVSVIGSMTNVTTPGYSYVCGSGSASDGRLSVSVHGYRFDQAKNIQFQNSSNQQPLLPDEVVLLVNASIANIGGGNVSIGGGWWAWILNGTYSILNTNLIANATFPNTYPNQTIPDVNGGLYLAPGGKADLWLFFYVRFQNVQSSNINQASGFKLEFVTFYENSYGGTYLGGGAYDCRKVPCQTPHVEFIVRFL
jgi:hypothetical protein